MPFLQSCALILSPCETLNPASLGSLGIYFEGRTWDNLGKVEDIATGSAAGPAGAYLCKHNLVNSAEPFVINQGRFVGRPSEIKVCVEGDKNEFNNVRVSGQVCKVANIDFV